MKKDISLRTEKMCNPKGGCGLVKPLQEFHNNKRSVDGKQYKCIPCCADYQKMPNVVASKKILGDKWREKNRESIRKKQRENRRDKVLALKLGDE